MARYSVQVMLECPDAGAVPVLLDAVSARRDLTAHTMPPYLVLVRTDVRAGTPRSACDKGLARLDGLLDGATVVRRSASRWRMVGFLTWTTSGDDGDSWDDGAEPAGDRAPRR